MKNNIKGNLNNKNKYNVQNKNYSPNTLIDLYQHHGERMRAKYDFLCSDNDSENDIDIDLRCPQNKTKGNIKNQSKVNKQSNTKTKTKTPNKETNKKRETKENSKSKKKEHSKIKMERKNRRRNKNSDTQKHHLQTVIVKTERSAETEKPINHQKQTNKNINTRQKRTFVKTEQSESNRRNVIRYVST